MSGKRIIKAKEDISPMWLVKSEDTKYEKWYNSIIEKAKARNEDELGELYETHHIIPICIGGTNDESNLVKLTYREHALAHKLLCEIYPHCPGIAYAVAAMMLPKKGGRVGLKYFSSREIAYYKTRLSEARKGKKLSDETRAKMSKVRKGVPHPISEKGLESLRKVLCSREVSEETRKKISENAKERYRTGRQVSSTLGKHLSKETKRKISTAQRLNSAKALKVQGPDGTIYNSINQCGEKNNVSGETIRRWIRDNPEKGFKLL